jgi:hypothetical protein
MATTDGYDPEDLTKVLINKKEYLAAPLPWHILKRLRPIMRERPPATTLEEEVDQAIEAFSICLIDDYPELTVEFIQKNLRGREADLIRDSYIELLRKGGFTGEGEAPAAGAVENPGTGTSTSSSPNAQAEGSTRGTGRKLKAA